MTVEYNDKAERLITLAVKVANSSFPSLVEEFPVIDKLVSDRRLFIFLMTVAGIVSGMAHTDVSDEEDINAFRPAAWESLHKWDLTFYEPFGEGSFFIAFRSLIDFVNDYTSKSETEYFWAVGYWVACNLKRDRPTEEEMLGANAISGFLKVVFMDWWNNELLNWLVLIPDEPDIYRSKHVQISALNAEAGVGIPAHLPAEEKERLIREQKEGTARSRQLIYEASTHQQAKHLLIECLETDKQFAFFIRNFETESSEKIIEGDHPMVKLSGDSRVMLTTISCSRESDDLIEARVRERIPIVGIANPADIVYRSKIPKMEVDDEDWYQVMQMIAERARIIVVLLSQFSVGISAELAALKKMDKKDSTVIVVVKEVNNWIFKYARDAAKESNFEVLEWPSVSARLSEYGTVIREDEIETRLPVIIDDMLSQ